MPLYERGIFMIDLKSIVDFWVNLFSGGNNNDNNNDNNNQEQSAPQQSQPAAIDDYDYSEEYIPQITEGAGGYAYQPEVLPIEQVVEQTPLHQVAVSQESNKDNLVTNFASPDMQKQIEQIESGESDLRPSFTSGPEAEINLVLNGRDALQEGIATGMQDAGNALSQIPSTLKAADEEAIRQGNENYKPLNKTLDEIWQYAQNNDAKKYQTEALQQDDPIGTFGKIGSSIGKAFGDYAQQVEDNRKHDADQIKNYANQQEVRQNLKDEGYYQDYDASQRLEEMGGNAFDWLRATLGTSQAIGDMGSDLSREEREEMEQLRDENQKNAWESQISGAIDNGTDADVNRGSNWISKEQLLKDYQHGAYSNSDQSVVDNRIKEIEAMPEGTILSKTKEQNEFGYVPNGDFAGDMMRAAEELAMSGATLNQDVTDARDNNANYGINIDGIRTTRDDFFNDGAADKYLNENIEKSSQGATYTVKGSNLVYDPSSNPLVSADEQADGSVIATFTFGNQWEFDSVDEFYDYFGQDNKGDEVWDTNLPDVPRYIDRAGNEFTYDQALRLWNDQIADPENTGKGGNFEGDEGITYDWGFLNWNKPRSLTNESDWLSDDFFAKLGDTTLSSAAYFDPRIAVPVALSNTYATSLGLDPTGYDTQEKTFTNSLAPLSEETKVAMREQGIDPEEYEAFRRNGQLQEKVTAQAMMPLTERFLGNVGGGGWFGKAVNKGIDKLIGTKPVAPILEQIAGIAGEGLEEIPSNIIEEAAMNGFSKGWFSDYLRGENGDILRSSAGDALKGQAVYDDDGNKLEGWDATMKRGEGFWGDAPDSFAAGAALGGAFSLLNSLLPGRNSMRGALQDANDIRKENKFKKKYGEDTYTNSDLYSKIARENKWNEE